MPSTPFSTWFFMLTLLQGLDTYLVEYWRQIKMSSLEESMRKIVIPSSTYNKMPYADTDVKWTTTKGNIEGKLLELREIGLLVKHGWTTEGKVGEEVETLYMELQIPLSDTQIRTIQLKFQPVMIFTEHWKGSVKRGDKRLVEKIRRNTSWRLFWWHFKTKLEAVQYGLETMENEFMSNIMYQLPDNRGEVTFGEALKTILLERKFDAVLEYKPDKKTIEAEYK